MIVVIVSFKRVGGCLSHVLPMSFPVVDVCGFIVRDVRGTGAAAADEVASMPVYLSVSRASCSA